MPFGFVHIGMDSNKLPESLRPSRSFQHLLVARSCFVSSDQIFPSSLSDSQRTMQLFSARAAMDCATLRVIRPSRRAWLSSDDRPAFIRLTVAGARGQACVRPCCRDRSARCNGLRRSRSAGRGFLAWRYRLAFSRQGSGSRRPGGRGCWYPFRVLCKIAVDKAIQGHSCAGAIQRFHTVLIGLDAFCPCLGIAL
jgi:hypothetical protein